MYVNFKNVECSLFCILKTSQLVITCKPQGFTFLLHLRWFRCVKFMSHK